MVFMGQRSQTILYLPVYQSTLKNGVLQISVMVLTNGVTEVIVVDIGYPESFEWRLRYTRNPNKKIQEN
jgi:hypothetical protein